MLCLPQLRSKGSRWRLPLPEHLATRLLAGLLEPQAGRRIATWRSLLGREPVFTLWCLCRLARKPVRSLDELAERLDQRRLTALHWTRRELKPRRFPKGPLLAELTVAGFAVSQLAIRSANGREKLGQAAALLGLVHGALDWLELGGPAIDLEDRPAGCLPRWLITQLRQVASDKNGQESPASLVAEAIRLQDETEAMARDSEAFRSELTDVHRDWLTSGNEAVVGAVLPRLVDRLARLDQLETEYAATLEREKLEAMRQFAYGASHEINNPLANISTRAQTLMRDETDPDRRRKLATINSQAFRAHEMISDMMLFARPPAVDAQSLELDPLIEQVLAELADDAREQETQVVHTRSDEPPRVLGDVVQLGAALKAVCVNALEAVVSGGTLTVKAQPYGSAEADERLVELSVHDTGPGIPADVRRHLFDPFYSGREAGRGLGLGLSKAWRVVTNHGGRILVSSEPDRGTTITFLLPAGRLAAKPTG